jgi:hypothetical protein
LRHVDFGKSPGFVVVGILDDEFSQPRRTGPIMERLAAIPYDFMQDSGC